MMTSLQILRGPGLNTVMASPANDKIILRKKIFFFFVVTANDWAEDESVLRCELQITLWGCAVIAGIWGWVKMYVQVNGCQ